MTTRSKPRCDACERRIRQNHHELRLSDFTTGQVIGHYHAHPPCRSAAIKYLDSGAVLKLDVIHPAHCGGDFEDCDGGMLELSA